MEEASGTGDATIPLDVMATITQSVVKRMLWMMERKKSKEESRSDAVPVRHGFF